MGGGHDSRGRLVFVEDDELLRTRLAKSLGREGYDVVCCSEVHEGLDELERPTDVLLVDVVLPDGSGLDVVRAARPRPARIIAISGYAGHKEWFELGRLCVDAYLHKPFSWDALVRALDGGECDLSTIGPVARAQVGRSRLHEVQQEVRDAMVEDALARTGGRRDAAGALLGISRQAIDKILK